MQKSNEFWIMLILTIIIGLDKLIENVTNLMNGFNNWWVALAPAAQLLLIIVVIYILFKNKK
jgi:hypothetical protein